MGLIGMGFLIGVIVAIAIISFMMSGKEQPKEKEYKREITLSEMITVVNYYYHFGRATTYEKEVMEALMEKLEEELTE